MSLSGVFFLLCFRETLGKNQFNRSFPSSISFMRRVNRKNIKLTIFLFLTRDFSTFIASTRFILHT